MQMVFNNVFKLLFCSVDDIIEHYRKEQIVEGYNLKDPVSNQVREISIAII